MEPSGRVLLVVLCLSLAVCVLGRPQPSSASPQSSTAVEVLGNSSLQGSNRNLGILHFGTLEVPWRRSLRRGGGRGSRSGGGVGGISTGYRARSRGGGGGAGMSKTVIIIFVVSILTFVLLLAALTCWCASKKRKNPNWRPTDCFRRNKVPREKMITSVKSDVDPDSADAERKVAIDAPRLDHAKSRKQVSLSHALSQDFKDSSVST